MPSVAERSDENNQATQPLSVVKEQRGPRLLTDEQEYLRQVSAVTMGKSVKELSFLALDET